MTNQAKARKTGAAPETQSPHAVGALRRVDAAAYLGISAPALDRLAVTGEGPRKVRLAGRTFGYRPADLDVWLAARVEPSKVRA